MNGASNESADCVVVGAGVIGLSVALELLRHDVDVLVFERDDGRRGATRAAGGMLAPVSEADTGRDALLELGLDSLDRYPEWVSDIEKASGRRCGFRREGSLWIATDRDEAELLDHVRETLRHKRLKAVPLEAAEVRRLEPHLSPRVVSGLGIESDRQVDPRQLATALAAAVIAGGGRVVHGHRVAAIEAAGGGLEIEGESPDGPFSFRCGRIVVCAGAWSESGIRLPAPPRGLRPVKGQLVRLRGPVLLGRVVRTPHVYLIPRADGELLIGATLEEAGQDEQATAGAVMELLRRAWHALPGIYDLNFTEVSVGLRSAVADNLPLIGESGTPGLYLAVGHYRNGILLAPATAYYLARWIVDGAAPSELDPFAPSRLAGLAPGVAAGARREEVGGG